MNISFVFRPLVVSAFSACALGLASCASGPTYSEVKGDLPPIAGGKGRVFVYRPSSLGAAIKPAVRIDGEVVGKSMGKGFLYTDQNPGSRKIAIKTEWNHENTISVEKGKATYVRCNVTPGILAAHVIPNQVDAATGESEIQDLKLAE